MKKIDLLKTWEDLTDAFLMQYTFNMDITPSCEDLTCTEKKENESFKTYATRWRSLAAQISPELIENELMNLFMKTLPPKYRNRMLGSTTNTFNQLIPISERIEEALRDECADEQTSTSRKFTKNERSLLVRSM